MSNQLTLKYVPVVDQNDKPLMPTSHQRADELLQNGRAIRRWRKGIFFIKLIDRKLEDSIVQQVSIGIDPGSKMEGFTVKSEFKTFINIQANAINYVKDRMEDRKSSRRKRRDRNTPYRKWRQNKTISKNLPPSIKARWNFKMRIADFLSKIYPISDAVVEDVNFIPKKGFSGNFRFSSVQLGKNFFYNQIIRKGWNLHKVQGYETFNLRQKFNLTKSKQKMSFNFSSHCVDSWTLANSIFNFTQDSPEFTKVISLRQIQLVRRALHFHKVLKGGVRRRKGGTRTSGLCRGSLVFHDNLGYTLLGGFDKNSVSLNDVTSNIRITKSAKVENIKFISHNSWILSCEVN